MREIRFRAWNNIMNTMVVSSTKRYDIIRTIPLEEQEYNLMQYTGLKDKNGKEIYDKDILQYETPNYSQLASPNPNIIRTENALAKIESVQGGFVLVREHWWNDQHYPLMGDAIADIQTRSWIEQNCEVIGNVYENPELLGKKDDNN